VHVVRNKILITAVLALVGSALALMGGSVRSPVTIAGLILVALSPVISFVIVYFWYGRRWSVRSKGGSSHA
jgi:drug/metabolite transporter (DMT)-like permease